MQSQREEVKQGRSSKGELLGEIRANIVSRTIREITPLGIRLESNGEGGITILNQNMKHVETVTVFQKLDGTFEWETKAMNMAMEGDMLIASARGSGRSTGPTTFSGEGEDFLMTQSPKLSQLNEKKVAVEFSGDQSTNEYRVKLYSM